MPRILFVKTSSLGDVVHQCPALSDAARALPGAQIDWMVEETFAAVPRMHRAVRAVIPVAVRRWRSAPWRPAVWREIGALRARLATERYDAIVDTQGLLKSALLCRLAKGPTHGFDASSAREPLAARLMRTTHRVATDRHAVERNRLLCALALGYAVGERCDYGLVAPREGAPAVDGAYVVLLSMTSRAAKLWPETHWVALARSLTTDGLRVVLPWGSAAERARCERIVAALGSGAPALVPPRLPVEGVAALLAGARGVVGVDTGLLHLAAALGTPAIGVYGHSDPARTGLHGAARARNLGGAQSMPQAAEVDAALRALWT